MSPTVGTKAIGGQGVLAASRTTALRIAVSPSYPIPGNPDCEGGMIITDRTGVRDEAFVGCAPADAAVPSARQRASLAITSPGSVGIPPGGCARVVTGLARGVRRPVTC
jgi:hypothetical protein